MGIKNSEKCDHCGEKDHIEHYFFHCINIRPFWTEVRQIIINKTNKVINLNEHIILLGIEQDINYDALNCREIKFIKNIVLIGKLSIIKSKIDNTDVSLIFEREVRIRNI